MTPVTNVTNAISKLRKLLKDDSREIITTVSKIGYRFSAKVERRSRPRRIQNSALKLGDVVPGRPHWRLTEHLDSGGYGDSWIATNSKTREQHVFKFCADAERLRALKRESTLFRVLRETLADRAPVPALLEWQFETPPYYTEAERWGQDMRSWAAQRGGLQNIPLDTRLQVLVLAAEAVTAVHAVGVLHNDLKPQNILVLDEAERIQVRLCDFGTGLLLDTAGPEALSVTRLGFTRTVANAGTPTYMAPELQFGGTPSVQSDIYSLGVMLYQLTIGEMRPLAFGWEADVADELLRDDIAATIHRDPERRLSSALLLAQRLRSIPERREQLERERQAQVRNAALKQALERTRARRPWMIAAAGVLLLAAAVSWSLMLQARHAAAAAAESARIATENEQIARAVADFLGKDLVRQASPDYGGHVDVTLKKAVLESIQEISPKLSNSAPVAAALDQSLADSLSTLSDPVEAAQLAHRAAELYSRLYGPVDRRTLSARVDEFTYRLLTEPQAKLAPEFRPLDETLRHTLPESDLVALKAALIRARLASMEARDEEALPILEAALAHYPPQPNPEELRWLDQTRLTYIKSLILNGRSAAAQDQATKLMPHIENAYGVNSRIALDLHRTLGHGYANEFGSSHNFPAAEAEFHIAVTGLTTLYGVDSTEVDFGLQDLGDLYIQTRRWTDAVQTERRVLSDFSAHYGPASLWTWRARLQLTRSLSGLAETNAAYTKSAVEMAEETIRLARQTLPRDDYMYRRALLLGAYELVAAKHDPEVGQIIDEVSGMLAQLPLGPVEHVIIAGQLDYLRGLFAERKRDRSSAITYFGAVVKELSPLGPDAPEVQDAKHRQISLRYITSADKNTPDE
ncbi:protein kinase domain-containing protein [Nevskia soli]|uniref:protein kinase domain-containing protein n=1 Tax=Nevskia soli TaxID=418856 RepID=UPI0004A6D8ED|nr:protein kinase [Nevskia soli]